MKLKGIYNTYISYGKVHINVFGLIVIALFISPMESDLFDWLLQKYRLPAQHTFGSFQLTLAFWLCSFFSWLRRGHIWKVVKSKS